MIDLRRFIFALVAAAVVVTSFVLRDRDGSDPPAEGEDAAREDEEADRATVKPSR